MRLPAKSHLKSTLKKLRAIPYEAVSPGDMRAAGQEALDFMAMLAGLKPVYVLGRGFGDPAWQDGVLELAASLDLAIVEGPFWIAPDAFADLPDWFANGALLEFDGLTAHYICKARAVADEVRQITAPLQSTLAQEARLLGFPECCVIDHYERSHVIHRVRYAAIRREGADDIETMRTLVEEVISIGEMTDDERVEIGRAIDFIPCPCTSLNLCEACANDSDSPAAQLARRYADLAIALDPTLYDLLIEGV